MQLTTNLFKKFRYSLFASVFALGLLTAGLTVVLQPNTPQVSAAACDRVNIVYCGLNGSGASGKLKSLRSFYNRGSDGRYHDLKAVYRWSGASNSDIQHMNTGNTKMGTMYRNGQVKVNGKVVATDAWVSARFGAGRKGFKHVEGNVYARKTTTSLAEKSTPVLVHFKSNGQADFAVMVTCGNAVKFTPKQPPKHHQPTPPKHHKPTPPPKHHVAKPQLQCDELTFSEVVDGAANTYRFTARASASHTTITSYDFDFGDGKTGTVTTGKQTASTTHQYANADQDYTTVVYVNSKDGQHVTSAKCRVTIPKQQECKPGVPVGSKECQPTPPPELPNTGAGSIIGFFSATTVAGGLIHRFMLRRKVTD